MVAGICGGGGGSLHGGRAEKNACIVLALEKTKKQRSSCHQPFANRIPDGYSISPLWTNAHKHN